GDEGTTETTKPSTTKPSTTKPTTTNPTTTKPAESGGVKTSYNLSDGKITGISPGTSPSKLIANLNLNLYGNATAALTNSKGAKLTSGYVGTGDKLTVTVNGKTGTYIAVVKGDTDGDGEITAVDLLMVRKNILGLYKLSGEYAQAADTDRSSNVDAVDLLMIRKHILKTYTIEQK
ncbi:MAG TPA: dockerin type I repeat-containing protein, partial [Oscillospiraceae bacterium]|nr:dockerin type I repeat-containing protein [Oscillospiraceae bacterium]